MDDREPKPISVTKLDAARRQIETAVKLWFSEGDPVSIHTLTAAAHQVCNALLKEQGEEASMVFRFDLLSPADQAGYKKFVLAPENFFKHAQRDADPAATIELIPRITELYLVDAIYLFHKLNGYSITSMMKAFSVYFEIFNPQFATDDSPIRLPELVTVQLRQVSKSAFLQAFLNVTNRLGVK